ncbi:plasma-membrane choline transporter-domain-containing protein [Phlebopus sp. FC_14]|nr:plasma-membrane choline transporter-domain-containing protein [Phlebopus sp. FC_14]
MANWNKDQWVQQGHEYQPFINDGRPAPGYSQPYAQPIIQPSYPPDQAYGDSKSPFEDGRFQPKKRVNDVFFLIFFILQLLAFAALSGIVLSQWVNDGGLGGGLGNGSQTGTSITLDQHTVYLLLLVTAAGLLLCTAYLMLARAFTQAIMHITLILAIVLNIAICVYYWITQYYSGAIIFTIIALFSVLAYFGFRSRIPLASLLLQVVMDISKHHLSVYFVAFAALLLQAALSVWFTFTAVAIYTKWTPGSPSCESTSSCSSGKVAGLIFYAVFSYLWTSQVIGNVALATLAGGPYGSWYYFGPREQGQMPKHPTLGAFARASTFSLGSIAFGSLIVTILEIIRLLLDAARNNANANGSPVEACLACCAECFIGCIESMVEYFNRYAYIEIALYGKPYIRAAKDTWRLFKDRGIDALVNDSLVGMTLMFGAYVTGLLCSLFGYLYLRLTHPSYNANGQYTAPVVLFAFLIGLQCSLTLSSAIEAGVSTIFVGLGEDPQVLEMRAPDLFGMIAQRYPRVVQGVPRV